MSNDNEAIFYSELYKTEEPPHLCPELESLEEYFGEDIPYALQQHLGTIKEMGHELRLWGRGNKIKHERLVADNKGLEVEVQELKDRLDFLSPEWHNDSIDDVRIKLSKCEHCYENKPTYFERRNGRWCSQCKDEFIRDEPDSFDEDDFELLENLKREQQDNE
jgi:hypothetical protein